MPLDDERPTHVSLFAGIDGIGLGLERAGFRTVASVEIDKFCNRVRAKRQPHVPQFGDIREFRADSLSREHGIEPGESESRTSTPLGRIEVLPVHRPDILSGGFPCQDLSVAGKRAGLTGARSGLFFEFVRVARELRPTWVLLENVPGLLSSNGGRDFAIVLASLGDAGYFVEWRVLDSRWLGVAQRRRRVFLVGHLGGPPARPVLFESEGGGGHPAARYEAGSDVAHALRSSTRGVGNPDGDDYIPELGYRVGRTHHGSPERGDMTLVAYRKQRRAADSEDDETWVSADEANTLNGFDVGDVRTTQAIVGASVRRLTPTEAERLQGFPDGWTCLCQPIETYDSSRCTCPDGPRYAALGNAVTVNAAEWVGRRILEAR